MNLDVGCAMNESSGERSTFGSFVRSWMTLERICLVLQEDFEYGKYDGHHTYFEGQGITILPEKKRTPLFMI